MDTDRIIYSEINDDVVSEVSFPFLERENEVCDRDQNVEKFSVALFENTDNVSRQFV